MTTKATLTLGLIGGKVAPAAQKVQAYKDTGGAIPETGLFTMKGTAQQCRDEALIRLKAMFKGIKIRNNDDWLVSSEQPLVSYQNGSYWLEIILQYEPKPGIRQAKAVGAEVAKIKAAKLADSKSCQSTITSLPTAKSIQSFAVQLTMALLITVTSYWQADRVQSPASKPTMPMLPGSIGYACSQA